MCRYLFIEVYIGICIYPSHDIMTRTLPLFHINSKDVIALSPRVPNPILPHLLNPWMILIFITHSDILVVDKVCIYVLSLSQTVFSVRVSVKILTVWIQFPLVIWPFSVI